MPFLYILFGLLLLIVIVLFLPLKVRIRFDGDFFAKFSFAGIKLYEIEPEKDIKKPKSADTESDRAAEKAPVKMFDKLKAKHGFLGSLKEIISFVKVLLGSLKKLLKHLKINKLKLDIKVSSDNAADTAVNYGKVCAAVYPALSAAATAVKINFKEVNISPDFDTGESDISFSAVISAKVLFLLCAAISAFKEYNKFRLRNEL